MAKTLKLNVLRHYNGGVEKMSDQLVLTAIRPSTIDKSGFVFPLIPVTLTEPDTSAAPTFTFQKAYTVKDKEIHVRQYDNTPNIYGNVNNINAAGFTRSNIYTDKNVSVVVLADKPEEQYGKTSSMCQEVYVKYSSDEQLNPTYTPPVSVEITEPTYELANINIVHEDIYPNTITKSVVTLSDPPEEIYSKARLDIEGTENEDIYVADNHAYSSIVHPTYHEIIPEYKTVFTKVRCAESGIDGVIFGQPTIEHAVLPAFGHTTKILPKFETFVKSNTEIEITSGSGGGTQVDGLINSFSIITNKDNFIDILIQTPGSMEVTDLPPGLRYERKHILGTPTESGVYLSTVKSNNSGTILSCNVKFTIPEFERVQ